MIDAVQTGGVVQTSGLEQNRKLCRIIIGFTLFTVSFITFIYFCKTGKLPDTREGH